MSMETAVWSAIGILAAAILGLAGLFFAGYQHFGARIDALVAELRSAIETQGRELRAAIEAQSREFRAAIEAQTARLDRHIELHS
jgi:hypothetical protein